ncbi:MAG: hypothetical protein EXR67_07285 [Dehalococcoidia bacterium]|nr:hypothetical protein [Dehalococcoidia bacterium]
MPNLPTHVALAAENADKLDIPLLKEHAGPYLLGSTTPDIRIITRRPREDTHFTTLDSIGITTGVEALFAAHPELADSSKLSEPTAAFLLGYCTHLIADQAWITNVYRPFFGNPAVFPNRVEANVLDRALQLELDRQRWDLVQSSTPFFIGATRGIEIGFISPDTLLAWNEWIQDYLARDFTWERLRFLAGRRQEETHLDSAHKVAEEFLRSPDKGLKKLAEKVSVANMRHYREQTLEHCLTVSKEYLKCA